MNHVDLIISMNPNHTTTVINDDNTTTLTHPLIKQMKVIDSEQFYQKKNGFIDYLNSTLPLYWKSSLMKDDKEVA